MSGTNPSLGWIPDDLSPAEQQFVSNAQQWNQTEMAYAREHSSKPQTLANALNDSPAGLAAWILEKFHRWTDCHGDLDSVYDRDDLLTNLTIYWATRTIGSSMRLYYETAPQHHRRLRPCRNPNRHGHVQRRHVPHSTRMGRTAVQRHPLDRPPPRRPFPGMGSSPAHRR